MGNPATPGQEGPSFAPPSLPEGWIAQWDGVSKKYYFVQLSTGVSQWEVPTHPAPTVATPSATPKHETSPYQQPGQQQEDGAPDGERSLGSMAMNTMLHSGGGGNNQSNPLLGLAGHFIGSCNHNSSNHSSNATAAGLVGALAGNLMNGGKKPGQGPQQNYSGQVPQGSNPQSHGGIMGDLTGKLGGMLGGTSAGQQNFGYSEGGHNQGGYTGQAPPTSYQPPAQGQQSYNHPTQGQQSYNGPMQGQQSYSSQISGPQGYSTTPETYPPQQIPGGYGNQQMQSYPQQPPQGASSGAPAYYNQQQLPYGGAPNHQQQYSQQQSYGGAQQQPYPNPVYNQPLSGNLEQSQHHLFQGLHNISHQGGLYGGPGSQAPPPGGNQPNQGPPGGYGAPGQGGNYY